MTSQLARRAFLFSLILIFLAIFPTFSFADLVDLTVSSCNQVDGTVTVTSCSGLNTSDDDADITLSKNAILGATMSDTAFAGTINSVTITFRHSGASGISGTVGITLYNDVNSTEFCSEDTTTSNTSSYTTDSIIACTPTGGWDTTKLDNLEVRIKNNDTGSPTSMYLSYLIVTIDYTPCTIACSSDADCDDSDASTIDTCNNPGTCDASCSYCTITCSSDSDCGAQETCSNPGTCSSTCTPAGCDTVCDATCADAVCYGYDPDCDTTGEATLTCCGNDKCEGDAGESCQNCATDCGVCPPDGEGAVPAVCGDGTCGTGENRCSCPSDCGSCSGDVYNEVCKEYQCLGGFCQKITKIDCCPNSMCEDNEDFAICRLDCKTPKQFFVTPLWESYYLRGENVNLLVDIMADSVKAAGANVKASGFFGELILYDDGSHNDQISNDGIFANSFTVGSDVNEGLLPITFDINLLQTEQSISLDLNVFPRLNLDVEIDREWYVIGQIIDLDGLVARRRNPIPASIDVIISKEGQLISDESVTANNEGFFESSYHTTTIDPDGEWVVSVKATDEFYNYQIVEKEIDVLGALMSNFLWIDISSPLLGSFKRGSELKVVVDVTDANTDTVSDATVELIAPNGDKEVLYEISTGTYAGSYTIPWNFGLGMQRFEISANKKSGELVQEGTTSFTVPIKEVTFITELIEPKQTSYMVGEEVEFRVRVSYTSGEAVKESIIKATINGEEVEMQPVEEGIYSTTYFIANPEMKKIEFSVDAKDAYENYSEKDVELEVSGISINYYIRTFPVTFFLLVFAVVLTILLILLSRMEARSLSSLKKMEAELLAQKKDLETQYFIQRIIDRSTFNKIKSEIDPELESVRKEIAKTEEKIRKRKGAFKRRKI